jgi:catalase
LWDSITSGAFPEWELCLQLFSEEQAAKFDFDVLDATKIVPEELVPLQRVGKLVLDRMPDNFFAETEQVAFCPANVVPGIDFSDDPLLQGRLFSYLDTQLSRLGSPNHHELPINAPKCPMHNFQRDGHMRRAINKGRVAYEPNTLGLKANAGEGAERESPKAGFVTFPRPEKGNAVRARSESFADHYSQARLFYVSQTPTEQNHIISALVFELSKVETPEIRERVLANFANIDAQLVERVAKGLGLPKAPAPAPAAVATKTSAPPSPSLSILKRAIATVKGRTVACLVSDGADGALVEALGKELEAQGAKLAIIAPKIAGVTLANGKRLEAAHTVVGGPSVLFDAVAVITSADGAAQLSLESAAQAFLRDAYAHLKVIGYNAASQPLFDEAGLSSKKDAGFVQLDGTGGVAGFVSTAAKHRIWDREPKVRIIP